MVGAQQVVAADPGAGRVREAPRAEQFGARPDPAGASRITVNPDPSDPANHPEANDPAVDLSVDPDAKAR